MNLNLYKVTISVRESVAHVPGHPTEIRYTFGVNAAHQDAASDLALLHVLNGNVTAYNHNGLAVLVDLGLADPGTVRGVAVESIELVEGEEAHA